MKQVPEGAMGPQVVFSSWGEFLNSFGLPGGISSQLLHEGRRLFLPIVVWIQRSPSWSLPWPGVSSASWIPVP